MERTARWWWGRFILSSQKSLTLVFIDSCRPESLNLWWRLSIWTRLLQSSGYPRTAWTSLRRSRRVSSYPVFSSMHQVTEGWLEIDKRYSLEWIVFVSRWVLPYLNICVAAIIRADWSPDTLYADTPFMAPFPALVSLDLNLSGIYSYRLVLSGFSMNRTEGSTPCIGDYFSQYARTKYLYTSVFNFLLQMQMLIRRTMNCRLRCKKAVRLVWQRLWRPLTRCRPTTPNWCWTNLWTTIPRRPTNWLLLQRCRPDVTVTIQFISGTLCLTLNKRSYIRKVFNSKTTIKIFHVLLIMLMLILLIMHDCRSFVLPN